MVKSKFLNKIKSIMSFKDKSWVLITRKNTKAWAKYWVLVAYWFSETVKKKCCDR